MNLVLVLIFLIFFDSYVSATEYFVCNCAAGADEACVNGNDLNSGDWENPWQSYNKARLEFINFSAGDSVHFCNGGVWTVNSVNNDNRWINNSCQAENRCSISNYNAEWANGDESLPLFQSVNSNAFHLADSGNASHEEGYLFKNLHLSDISNSGEQSTSRGFFIANDIDDVTIDNVIIEGFDIGVYVGNSNECEMNDPKCDGKNERIILTNSQITNNYSFGWLGSSSGSEISNNYFAYNGTLQTYDHNIYINTATEPTLGMKVINNQLYKNTLDENGSCGSVSLVVHGMHDDLLIENNEIWEDIGLTERRCWGIAVDNADGSESFHNLIIRGNTIKNVGNTSIAVGGCSQCVIENNVIINLQQSFSYHAINLPSRGDFDSIQALIVRNNSIYIDTEQNATAIALNFNGDSHVMVNNTIHYNGTNPLFNCLETNLPFSSLILVDNNNCYFPNALNSEWMEGIGDLQSWQLLSGFDLQSTQENPGYLDPINAVLIPASENSVLIDSGNIQWSSNDDIRGYTRDDSPDIGAYEWIFDDLIFSNGFENQVNLIN